MTRIERDEIREERIRDEAIVDAHGPEEQAISWYYYLDDMINETFHMRCNTKRAISPLVVGDDVEVFGMAPATECQTEMFVMIRWGNDDLGLGVPLSQLVFVDGDDRTQQAVEDWLYWVARGYTFY